MGLLLSVCVGLVPTASADAAKLEDRIVAVVNSDLIMWSELKRDLLPDQERLRKLYKGEELERRLKTAEGIAVTKMIERKLQLQAAKNKGVDVSDQEVAQAMEEMKKQIETEKESAIRDIRRQVAVLSVGIAEKIMRNKLADEKEQAALIDRLLDEMIETSKK